MKSRAQKCEVLINRHISVLADINHIIFFLPIISILVILTLIIIFFHSMENTDDSSPHKHPGPYLEH